MKVSLRKTKLSGLPDGEYCVILIVSIYLHMVPVCDGQSDVAKSRSSTAEHHKNDGPLSYQSSSLI